MLSRNSKAGRLGGITLPSRDGMGLGHWVSNETLCGMVRAAPVTYWHQFYQRA
ncbi:MAG TPA: hypothetical protein VN950_13570 [Terriglobales bacterium]|nr:hypothetical protein [Terriglobales bacterium]